MIDIVYMIIILVFLVFSIRFLLEDLFSHYSVSKIYLELELETRGLELLSTNQLWAGLVFLDFSPGELHLPIDKYIYLIALLNLPFYLSNYLSNYHLTIYIVIYLTIYLTIKNTYISNNLSYYLSNYLSNYLSI